MPSVSLYVRRKHGLAAADSEEHLLFSFFLATGAREQEVMCAFWSDVDLEDGVFTVRDHPEFGFVPKDREMREIPLPAQLMKRLKARERTSDLIFPKNGKPKWPHVAHAEISRQARLRRPEDLRTSRFQKDICDPLASGRSERKVNSAASRAWRFGNHVGVP